jgi:hypothetical protein
MHRESLSRFRQFATCLASRDPQAAQTAQPIPAKNGPTEWAYSPTVKPPRQESSRGRDERTAHSYNDIAAATNATPHFQMERGPGGMAVGCQNSVRAARNRMIRPLTYREIEFAHPTGAKTRFTLPGLT